MMLSNWLAWCAHVAVLVGAGILGAQLFRWRHPQSKLRFFQLLLIASLLLPLAEPWRVRPVERPAYRAPAAALAQKAGPGPRVTAPVVSWDQVLFCVLPAGALVQLSLLGVGLLRLHSWRRRGRPLPIEAVVGVEIREVDGIKGPAAFGWLRPVILLPEGMPAGPVRYAALLHELQHVIRRDWLENVLERAAASLLWFHPMIWWLLERIHLTREQAVDSEVAGAGAERDHYLHALLSSAGLANLPALPVAGFVRRPRHLVERVAFLSEEYKMSKRATAASAALAALVSGAALAAAAFYLPLQLTAQQAEDSPLHWTRMTRIGEGTVQLEAIVNSAGEVVDARVVSGPDELRKQALQSVLVSHFAKDSAERRILPVTIDFRKSLEAVAGGLVGGVTGGIIGGVPAPPALEQATFEGVDYAGLSTELQQRAAGLMASLRSGQKITTAQVEQFRGELAAIDPSLRLGLSMRESGDGKGTLLRFNVNNLPAPERIRVGAAVQDQNLISKVEPEYPALARQARIQGTVRFQIMIGKDGSVQQIQLVSGHPLLVEPAQKAVSQYKYKPTLLNGNQIAVQTLVDVNFVL